MTQLSTYVQEAREAAVEWKWRTTTLPIEAKLDGQYRGTGPMYPFCLPFDLAELNLLPDARAIALERFEAAGIRWHGDTGRPNNHRLSSQVMCLNALAPFVDQPHALRDIFGSELPIAKVLPFGADTASTFDATDHVVLEWIGLDDHLGERDGDEGVRGAMTTSADAAIRYRTDDGAVEVALIEWKYTESYPEGEPLSGGPARLARRMERYRSLFEDPDAPIDADRVAYDELFHEPWYQLMRLQLLAWRMEEAHELGADRVRVVYAAPFDNSPLLMPPSIRPTVELMDIIDLWQARLRRPDRFVYFDTADLMKPEAPTSAEFKDRYGHLYRQDPNVVYYEGDDDDEDD